jgi:hypothetical protein
VVDPYGFSTLTSWSAFRRPSPTANESKVPATGWAGNPVDPFTQVASTSAGATRGHEQRPDPLPTETINAMRDFQIGVVFAQSIDWFAGRLDSDGAKGGPVNLLAQAVLPGHQRSPGQRPDAPGPALQPQGVQHLRRLGEVPGPSVVGLPRPGSRRHLPRQEIFNNREFT